MCVCVCVKRDTGAARWCSRATPGGRRSHTAWRCRPRANGDTHQAAATRRISLRGHAARAAASAARALLQTAFRRAAQPSRDGNWVRGGGASLHTHHTNIHTHARTSHRHHNRRHKDDVANHHHDPQQDSNDARLLRPAAAHQHRGKDGQEDAPSCNPAAAARLFAAHLARLCALLPAVTNQLVCHPCS